MKLSKEFWEERYEQHQTGWDIGYASIPLSAYLQKLTIKNQRILIPGAGNAHEVKILLKNGFTNITVLDIAERPLKELHDLYKGDARVRLVNEDFFAHKGSYDLIIEQTFFCAIDPVLRPKYVQKMDNLMADGSRLFGLLFNFELTEIGPPFGGSIIEYQKLFEGSFKIHKLEACYNSIKPRMNNELFIELLKR